MLVFINRRRTGCWGAAAEGAGLAALAGTPAGLQRTAASSRRRAFGWEIGVQRQS